MGGPRRAGGVGTVCACDLGSEIGCISGVVSPLAAAGRTLRANPCRGRARAARRPGIRPRRTTRLFTAVGVKRRCSHHERPARVAPRAVHADVAPAEARPLVRVYGKGKRGVRQGGRGIWPEPVWRREPRDYHPHHPTTRAPCPSPPPQPSEPLASRCTSAGVPSHRISAASPDISPAGRLGCWLSHVRKPYAEFVSGYCGVKTSRTYAADSSRTGAPAGTAPEGVRGAVERCRQQARRPHRHGRPTSRR